MDRMLANDSITRLIESEGHDESARAEVAALLDGIGLSQLTIKYHGPTKNSDTFTGLTNAGEFAFKDGDDNKPREIVIGKEQILRIGDFKLKAMKDRNGYHIYIERFWGSTDTYNHLGDRQSWQLKLDNNKQPVWFGESAKRENFAFNIPWVSRVTVSSKFYVETWPKKGVEHVQGIAIHSKGVNS